MLGRKVEENISERHPFDVAQGRLSDSRQRGFAPLHTPYFISLIVDAHYRWLPDSCLRANA